MMEANPSLLGMGLLYKKLQLLAEKSQSSKCGLIKLLLISLVMVKIYRVIR